MTPTMIFFYFVSLIVSPFAGVLISYLISKNHTNSSQIGGVMALGAILSMGFVGVAFPAVCLVTGSHT